MKKIVGGTLFAFLMVLVGCASTGNPAVGTWDVSMSTPVGAMPATLVINDDGTGMMEVEGMGSQAISGVMVDGNSVNFSSEIDAQGQLLTLTFSGMVEGDSLSGEFASDFGAFGVTGTRQ